MIDTICDNFYINTNICDKCNLCKDNIDEEMSLVIQTKDHTLKAMTYCYSTGP